MNEDLGSESTAPPNLAISESELAAIDREESQGESLEAVQSTVGTVSRSVIQRVDQSLEEFSLELSHESSSEPSYLDPPPSIDPPRIDHGVNLSQPPSLSGRVISARQYNV